MFARSVLNQIFRIKPSQIAFSRSITTAARVNFAICQLNFEKRIDFS